MLIDLFLHSHIKYIIHKFTHQSKCSRRFSLNQILYFALSFFLYICQSRWINTQTAKKNGNYAIRFFLLLFGTSLPLHDMTRKKLDLLLQKDRYEVQFNGDTSGWKSAFSVKLTFFSSVLNRYPHLHINPFKSQSYSFCLYLISWYKCV